jgi:hypothetical protein
MPCVSISAWSHSRNTAFARHSCHRTKGVEIVEHQKQAATILRQSTEQQSRKTATLDDVAQLLRRLVAVTDVKPVKLSAMWIKEDTPDGQRLYTGLTIVEESTAVVYRRIGQRKTTRLRPPSPVGPGWAWKVSVKVITPPDGFVSTSDGPVVQVFSTRVTEFIDVVVGRNAFGSEEIEI